MFSPIAAILLIATFIMNVALNGDTLHFQTDMLLFLCCISIFFTLLLTVMTFHRKKMPRRAQPSSRIPSIGAPK